MLNIVEFDHLRVEHLEADKCDNSDAECRIRVTRKSSGESFDLTMDEWGNLFNSVLAISAVNSQMMSTLPMSLKSVLFGQS